MDKICARCGFAMQEDDFLCPACGAIWGDPVYRKPAPAEPEPVQNVPEGEKAEKVLPPKKPASKWRGPAMIALVLLLAFSLFAYIAMRHGNRDLENNGQNTTASTTKDPKSDFIFTGPAVPSLDDITYTVTFLDPSGNPIPNVKFAHPDAIFSSAPVTELCVSDKNGLITFISNRTSNVGFQILEVPDGYSTQILQKTLYFADGQTDMVIKLKLEEVTLYSVTMLDPDWLAEPLQKQYAAGELIKIKVNYDAGMEIMLFCNGFEVTNSYTENPGQRIFRLSMPEEDVILDLKVYDIPDTYYEYDYIMTFYREHPDAEDVSIFHCYGRFQYGAVVAIVDHDAYDHEEYHSEVVAGFLFQYANTDVIRVLMGGKFFSLQRAYDLGYLTESELEQIYNQHVELFQELYTYDTMPAERPA